MITRTGKVAALVLFNIYIIAVLYVTLFAWNYGASLGPEGPGGRNYNLIPFRSIYRIAVFSPSWWNPVRLLIGDIVLFIPFGILLPLVQRRVNTLLKITGYGFIFTVVIETSQFVFTHRVANVDDVILNTFGAFTGGLMYLIGKKLTSRIYYIPNDSINKKLPFD
ncbi:VanZ family protein [Halalkalibacterium ligniniphilum]|uniref:VanZ family protein n=1 Tax=Halalkalibacterium ligniniphilum TaxID=1134413 RepID=UPI00034AF65F|nr:VanZ family protein [Halalkalibacterium ligniniphilum]